MNLEYRTFEPQNQTSDVLTKEDISATVFEKHHPAESLAAFDVDQNLFTQDLGILIFLKKLLDRTFWTYSTGRFSRFLFPSEYQNIFSSILRGKKYHQKPDGEKILFDVSQEKVQFLFNLYSDIVVLYDLQHKLQKKGGPLSLKNSITQEFARKMIEFDRIMMECDKFLSKIFDGQLLLRTRFFAGKNVETIKSLTKDVMIDIRREIRLTIDDIPEKHNVRLFVGPDHLPEEIIYTGVDVNMSIYSLLESSENFQNCESHVVSTGIFAAVKQAIEHSPYIQFLKRKDSDLKTMNGTEFEGSSQRLTHRVKGSPPFASRKREILMEAQKERNKKVIFASGDSASNDTNMMTLALQNDGFAMISGRIGVPYEETRENFIRAFRSTLNMSEKEMKFRGILERIIYADMVPVSNRELLEKAA